MSGRDGDLRMLGANDGFAHALILVRNQIASIDGRYAPPIHPLHVRKRAQRDAVLKPLREIESRLAEWHRDTRAAYDKTVEAERTALRALTEAKP